MGEGWCASEGAILLRIKHGAGGVNTDPTTLGVVNLGELVHAIYVITSHIVTANTGLLINTINLIQ